MVCNRCLVAVQRELDQLGLQTKHVKLGEVLFENNPNKEKIELFKTNLSTLGFEAIDDKKRIIIEQIKSVIIEIVHHREDSLKENLSDILSKELQQEYHYLSSLFSEIQGVTIEKYYIAQKIEKVKELLVYDELSLSEIAIRLHYSSVAYLSNQFKKVTGLTPSYYKKVGENRRKPLDEV